MIKRISCRVVSSVPLGGVSESFHHASRLDNNHYNAGSPADLSFQSGNVAEPIAYTTRPGRAKASIDDSWRVLGLDFYA